jgi:hypothetical protein
MLRNPFFASCLVGILALTTSAFCRPATPLDIITTVGPASPASGRNAVPATPRFAASSRGTNSVCVNGRCFSCNGTMVCNGSNCTCNGTSVEDRPDDQQRPCGSQNVATHPNGGGAVATSATVDPTAFVSKDSAVCGTAKVSAPARLINGSLLSGDAVVVGRSLIDASTLDGGAVSDSSIVGSTVNGPVRVTGSQVRNSTINGEASVERSRIMNSVLNDAEIVGRTLDGAVIND